MPILPIDGARYGSEEMRAIFEESHRLAYLLKVEAEAAKAQGKVGLIPKQAAKAIAEKASSNRITLEAWKSREKAIGHDIAALVELVVEACNPQAQPWVHYGLTSNDILDTATSLQLKEAFALIKQKMRRLALALAEKAERYRHLPAVGRTHGQHASIISFGLRFAIWASELLRQLRRVQEIEKEVLVCKTLGAVGTGSVMGSKALLVQEEVGRALGLRPVEAATQVVPRELYADVIYFAASLSATLDRIAVTLRNLQRTEIGEVEEPFAARQVGSSAMPAKRNPIQLEKVSSLARLLRGLVSVALENVVLWEERDLSNSANERFSIPMAFILLDEAINATTRVLEGLTVREKQVAANLEKGAWAVYSEFLLDLLLKKGLPRHRAYRIVQKASWQAHQGRQDLASAILKDKEGQALIRRKEVQALLRPETHMAASGQIIGRIVAAARETCSESPPRK